MLRQNRHSQFSLRELQLGGCTQTCSQQYNRQCSAGTVDLVEQGVDAKPQLNDFARSCDVMVPGRFVDAFADAMGIRSNLT